MIKNLEIYGENAKISKLKKTLKDIANPPILTSFTFLNFLELGESKIQNLIPIFFDMGTNTRVKINEVINIIKNEEISVNIINKKFKYKFYLILRIIQLEKKILNFL